jgi:hypothetical protein
VLHWSRSISYSRRPTKPIWYCAIWLVRWRAPAGPDTYTLSERVAYIAGGSERAKELVLTKANAHCEKQGRKFAPTVMRSTWDGIPGYEVAFSCLLPGDPRLANWSVG